MSLSSFTHDRPSAEGLYDPANEHDGCGIGFIAHLRGDRSHAIVRDALALLVNLAHRSATGADAETGDGSGILLHLPHAFLRAACRTDGIALPEAGAYGAGMVFLPSDAAAASAAQQRIEHITSDRGCRVLGWRDVPVADACLSASVRSSRPLIRQFFVAPFSLDRETPDAAAFERTLFVIRRTIEREALSGVYVASLSTRTIVYKGLLRPDQLPLFYSDLTDPQVVSGLALVHSRFSTNTFPSWPLAHPYRLVCHNGEINTLRGNVNWMRAREADLASPRFADGFADVLPIIQPAQSDSAAFDNVLELLVQAGRPIAHAVAMLVPEAWERDDAMPADRRAFYEYHASLMEPWDGPAAIAFTDGRHIGAIQDRNGLRPARWLVTDDDRVVLASETGALPIPSDRIREKGRLQPGRMLLVNTTQGRLLHDDEIKSELASLRPYRRWLAEQRVVEGGKAGPSVRDAERATRYAQREGKADPPLVAEDDSGFSEPVSSYERATRAVGSAVAERGKADPPLVAEDDSGFSEPVSSYERATRAVGSAVAERGKADPSLARDDNRRLQRLFGYTREELSMILRPMATNGEEPVGSMGNDTPLAILSERPQLLYSYFRQLFAQVTNPAIDPIREQIVMSLRMNLGPQRNLLDETPEHARQIRLEHPILSAPDFDSLQNLNGVKSRTLSTLFRAHSSACLSDDLESLCDAALASVRSGCEILVLSDRGANRELAPMPSLLALAAVHHRLMREGCRARVGLVVETGDAREVSHIALLFAYGASAVYPYLALDSCALLGSDPSVATANYIKAVEKGMLKILSKMGISTLRSFCGAQICEIVGLDRTLVDRHFTGTASPLGGIGLAEVAHDVLRRHTAAYEASDDDLLEAGGEYHYRVESEQHNWNPRAIATLQRATREGSATTFADFSRQANESHRGSTLRGLLELVEREPVPLDEVEPATEIVRRFATGAMSFGSISPEAHETLAIAMNSIGGRSNTGEGGEDPSRFGTERNSAIKQVASARFGVTAEYLVNARELQIKIAQGAKPGEGGQLPGHKVDETIARTRHSLPGVTLISPPPHHDIYSIEDLKQLIYDLRTVNPAAMISVKLVAEAGVGTVAAGVAKADADLIVISGDSGGTGASPLSSIKRAGIPWELGLAETQQTLVLNGLRGKVRLQVDGQLKTGRDVVIAALLGAEEFGFATAPLIVEGCVMMRKCHLNTCPVGIATQDPMLRAHFAGRPEHLVNYFFFVAEEVRALMARLGYRTMDEMVGRVDSLRQRDDIVGKARSLDLSPLLHSTSARIDRRYAGRVMRPAATLDETLMERLRAAIDGSGVVSVASPIRNVHRAVGAQISGEIARRHGADGLAPDAITLRLTGSAGQSFGAFAARGLTLELEGEANDYVGKGLSGGRLVIRGAKSDRLVPDGTVIVGNTSLYGATSGEAFIAGGAGERFAVRNSGATAVVEGVGDHGCEYMTGGIVVVLGGTGRNFAAGMSGGVAYVFDETSAFRARNATSAVEISDVVEGHDRQLLRELVERHWRYTGSRRAKALLASWPEAVRSFVRLMPLEYKRALEREAAKAAESEARYG